VTLIGKNAAVLIRHYSQIRPPWQGIRPGRNNAEGPVVPGGMRCTGKTGLAVKLNSPLTIQ
jgi:hypothetical protein